MLSIVDAFDSMTTDHVYRPARSRERAIAELFRCAGTQFDPELVRKFSELFALDQNLFTEKLARHWLRGLSRHADHHQFASRPYQELRFVEEAPVLPRGYVSLIPLVVVGNREFQRLAIDELRRKRLGPFAPPGPAASPLPPEKEEATLA